MRRIRVRATEIETFDRASVIIPNSELITGVVKNWTRANTLGRIDHQGRRLLRQRPRTGARHPHRASPGRIRRCCQTPPPRGLPVGFGDNALEFELRCIVLNVDATLTVKSDVHFAIIKAFREAGIEMSSELLSEAAARRWRRRGRWWRGKTRACGGRFRARVGRNKRSALRRLINPVARLEIGLRWRNALALIAPYALQSSDPPHALHHPRPHRPPRQRRRPRHRRLQPARAQDRQDRGGSGAADPRGGRSRRQLHRHRAVLRHRGRGRARR